MSDCCWPAWFHGVTVGLDGFEGFEGRACLSDLVSLVPSSLIITIKPSARFK